MKLFLPYALRTPLDFATVCHYKNALIVLTGFTPSFFQNFISCLKFHFFMFAKPISQINCHSPIQNVSYLCNF